MFREVHNTEAASLIVEPARDNVTFVSRAYWSFRNREISMVPDVGGVLRAETLHSISLMFLVAPNQPDVNFPGST
jgi:hypothetical protein